MSGLAVQKTDFEDLSAAGEKADAQPGAKAPGAFRTIGEVCEYLDVQQHVLRFWETKFSQIRPLKRGGGRRYYRPEDVILLKTIHNLLYAQGYTIKGVQKLLKEQGKNAVVQNNRPQTGGQPSARPALSSVPATHETGLSEKHKALLREALSDLKDLRAMVEEV